VLLSATDEEVLAAAEELGEELRNVQQESTQFEFSSLLMRCSDTITEEIGIDYSSACDADSCC
jgi:hypothetical protein